jgi:hypothetical protein
MRVQAEIEVSEVDLSQFIKENSFILPTVF